jgi:enamine deaminase RidA (YjgF/YER057c/UK114 family)
VANVTLIRSDSLADTPGYAHASVVGPGTTLIHLAGACPLDANGVVVPVGDFAGQALQCIENMLVALNAVGASMLDVAYTRVLVASAHRDDLAAVWEAIREAFADHEVPSTLFGVSVLGYEHQLVEVEAVAAVRE